MRRMLPAGKLIVDASRAATNTAFTKRSYKAPILPRADFVTVCKLYNAR